MIQTTTATDKDGNLVTVYACYHCGMAAHKPPHPDDGGKAYCWQHDPRT